MKNRWQEKALPEKAINQMAKLFNFFKMILICQINQTLLNVKKINKGPNGL